jgi:tetratricopeptide (TPR) repeat protein
VILEIEDLHWIDEASEDFLAFLVEGLAASRMLLLLTYRSGYQPRWIEKSYATQISMRRLTARDSQSVIDSILRRSKLPEELARIVLAKAEGNPFFLEELTRSILEDSSWTDVSVPDTIQGVLIARIDRLPEEHKRLLQTASVLGREFTPDLLEAVWEQPGTAMPLLTDLKKWEFLYEAPTLEMPVYFFKHALTQEAVYQSLLTGRRQALHLAAGRALEILHADHLPDVYDSLVHHFPKAGDAEKSVTYLSLFAQRAARGYAHTEAARALREAVEHARRLPPARKDRAILELILQLAESLLPLAHFSETLELFLQHEETVARAGDPSLAGRYFFWLAHTYSYLGNQEAASWNAQRAIEASRQCGDEAIEGKACYVLSRDGFWSGRFSEGLEYSRRAVALLEGSEDRWWQGQAYWVSGFNFFAVGRFDEALQAMARVRAIWRALVDPRLDASWSTGYFYACLGAWDKGIAECRGGLDRAKDPLNTAAALGFLGYAYLEKRDLPSAIKVLEESVQRTKLAGMQQLLGWFSVFLGEAYTYAGRLDEAEELARQALAVTSEVKFGYGIGLALRALGSVALERKDCVEARQRLEAASAQFEMLRVSFEVARTQLELVALARSEGRIDEAVERLAQARNTFIELGVPRYVERADQMNVELSLPLSPARAASAGMV